MFGNKKQRKDKEFADKKSEDYMFGSDYEVGDCLMSVKDMDDNYQSSDDQDQLDIIEEQIHKKISGIKDMKQLN